MITLVGVSEKNEDAKGGGYPTKVFFSFSGEVFGICAQVPVSFLALLWMPLPVAAAIATWELEFWSTCWEHVSHQHWPDPHDREERSFIPHAFAALLPFNSTPCREHQVDLGWISSGWDHAGVRMPSECLHVLQQREGFQCAEWLNTLLQGMMLSWETSPTVLYDSWYLRMN